MAPTQEVLWTKLKFVSRMRKNGNVGVKLNNLIELHVAPQLRTRSLKYSSRIWIVTVAAELVDYRREENENVMHQ